MMFWRNAVLLIAIAAWVPIVVGLLGRVFYFRPDRNQSAAGAERVVKAREDEFEIPNQEPQEGDEAFRPPFDWTNEPRFPGPRDAASGEDMLA